jgi:hypothetical protein
LTPALASISQRTSATFRAIGPPLYILRVARKTTQSRSAHSDRIVSQPQVILNPHFPLQRLVA